MAEETKRRIRVCDTTLRDGEQAPGFHMTAAEKARVAGALARLGVDVIEAGFPASSNAEWAAVAAIASTVGRGAEAPIISAFGRAVAGDIDAAWEAVRTAERPRLHTFIATSDLHLEHKLRMTRQEAMRRAVDAVRRAASHTADVQFSPEDAFRSDRDFLVEILEAVIEAGATTVNITDTVGYATPPEFADLISTIRRRVRNSARAAISVHCHDDLGLANANTLAAVAAGAAQVECTVNGIGERAGNCALEEIVMAIAMRGNTIGAWTGVHTREIVPTSELVSAITSSAIAPNKAVVGGNAFAHASGIHQDGMLKNRSTYEIMRPEDVGRSGTSLPLTARSGRAAVFDRLARLGRRPSEDRVDDIFARFKEVAERMRVVDDETLVRLIGA